jgi:hypothetical protein
MSIIHGYLFKNTLYKNKNDELLPFRYLILEMTPNHIDLEPFLKEIIFSMSKRLFDYFDNEFLVIVLLKHVYAKTEISVITNNDSLLENFNENEIKLKEELQKNPNYEIVGYDVDKDTIGSVSCDDIGINFELNNLCCYF